MKRTLFILLTIGLGLATFATAQNRFDGYSLTVNADNSGACPLRFMPQQNQGNFIQVFLPGTNMQRPATGLTACDNSRVQGSTVGPNTADQKWCFQGPEELYEIKLTNGDSYLWPMAGRDTGFYNVKDFRPLRRIDGPEVKYAYSEPADYTKAIRNAMMVMASRQGGTLTFPGGDYIVGTTDGNTRDPSFEAITVPSGVTIIGASYNYSIPTTNMPNRSGAARIRVRNNKQTIFRIGGCTNSVTIRNIELLGNSGLYGEGPRDSSGNYGVEALGKWPVDPVTKVHMPNQSQFFRFESVTFQNLDIGIYVHNTDQDRCDSTRQMCNQWQFDNIRVDHGVFLNNKTGIKMNTFNTDWTIANSQFNYYAANAPGYGIHIVRAAGVVIQNTFGGGVDYGRNIGDTFLYLDSVGTLTLIGVSAERTRRSIYTVPETSASSQMMTVVGSVFGDPIELNGRLNYISTGNFYSARTVKSAPTVTITSTGDRFCHDPLTMPGSCVEPGTSTPATKPGFGDGRVMLRTGRLPEGQGNTMIDRQPNFFGYDVEIGNGLMQFDSNVTFAGLAAFVNPPTGSSRVKDGAIVYCKDCRKAPTGLCTQGQIGVDGAFAKRINNQWRCD